MKRKRWTESRLTEPVRNELPPVVIRNDVPTIRRIKPVRFYDEIEERYLEPWENL